MQVTPLRSYRAITVPSHLRDDQVEDHDAAGLLPAIRLKAVSNHHAMTMANHVTGQRVLRAERVEDNTSHRCLLADRPAAMRAS